MWRGFAIQTLGFGSNEFRLAISGDHKFLAAERQPDTAPEMAVFLRMSI
jgi:hypothetical protein